MNRRAFLASGLLAAGTAWGDPLKPGSPAQVDVHHHLFPPRLRETLAGKIPDAFLPGVEQSLKEIDASGTARAVISFPNSDITTLKAQELSPLIRESNDYAAGLVMKWPERYRLFASLPMPHIDASLKELARIGSEIPADGVLLITNYGNRWLGDPEFSPLLEELDRRGLLVYVHPNAADCCRGLLHGVSDSIVEFQTDTSRTIASLLFTGTAERMQKIRFLFSHSGGTLPSLVERFERAPKGAPALAAQIPKGATWYLRRFLYDTAQTANAGALGALLKIVPDSQVMFGSDFPYRTASEQVRQIREMHLGAATTQRILATNAQRILRL